LLLLLLLLLLVLLLLLPDLPFQQQLLTSRPMR